MDIEDYGGIEGFPKNAGLGPVLFDGSGMESDNRYRDNYGSEDDNFQRDGGKRTGRYENR